MKMESTDKQQSMTSNTAFLHPNVLQFRLDTSDLIANLQKFLSGKILIPQPQPDGSTKIVEQSIGDKICTQKGSQQIVNYVQGIINPSVVQGNYTLEQYQNHVNRIHQAISRQLLVNYHDWEMNYEDLEFVNDFIMNLVETFLSRLIDNKERDSYAQSLKVAEASRVDTSRGFSFFGGRK